VPQKRKEQSEPTSEGTERSSQVKDLRTDILERLDEIVCDARWVRRRIEHAPVLPSGEGINRRIARWRQKTRELVGEYVVGLANIFHDDFGAVRRETEVLWPSFDERAKSWVTTATMTRWKRLALANVRRQIEKKYSREGSTPIPSWESLKNLRSILRIDAAKYLNCTPRTVYNFVRAKRLNTAENGRVICDDKLRIELRKKHGESYR
jgi:hypothetical protein